MAREPLVKCESLDIDHPLDANSELTHKERGSKRRRESTSVSTTILRPIIMTYMLKGSESNRPVTSERPQKKKSRPAKDIQLLDKREALPVATKPHVPPKKTREKEVLFIVSLFFRDQSHKQLTSEEVESDNDIEVVPNNLKGRQSHSSKDAGERKRATGKGVEVKVKREF